MHSANLETTPRRSLSPPAHLADPSSSLRSGHRNHGPTVVQLKVGPYPQTIRASRHQDVRRPQGLGWRRRLSAVAGPLSRKQHVEHAEQEQHGQRRGDRDVNHLSSQPLVTPRVLGAIVLPARPRERQPRRQPVGRRAAAVSVRPFPIERHVTPERGATVIPPPRGSKRGHGPRPRGGNGATI
jgi:hypothetical protein